MPSESRFPLTRTHESSLYTLIKGLLCETIERHTSRILESIEYVSQLTGLASFCSKIINFIIFLRNIFRLVIQNKIQRPRD